MSLLYNGIVVSCVVCADTAGVAASAGIPPELITAPKPNTSKVGKALRLLRKSVPIAGTPVETYLRGRGIVGEIPCSIRSLPRQYNWTDGMSYPAMISRVERVQDDASCDPSLQATGIHLTFLQGPNAAGRVGKALMAQNKLSLGQLRYGGVWFLRLDEVGADIAVAEGIETALSVQQMTGLPTVAALSAAGMQTFKWPPQVRRIWIAADRDEAGSRAASHLRCRAEEHGLDAHIRFPANGRNDFNDLLKENN